MLKTLDPLWKTAEGFGGSLVLTRCSWDKGKRERERQVWKQFLRWSQKWKPESAAAGVLTLDPRNERRLVGLCRQKASGLLSDCWQAGQYCYFLLSAALFCWWQLFSKPDLKPSGAVANTSPVTLRSRPYTILSNNYWICQWKWARLFQFACIAMEWGSFFHKIRA